MSTMSDLAITMFAAHDYIDRGWHVLACQPRKKDPYFNFAPKAYLSATTDHDKIDTWFEKVPTLNIGIAARQSGLIILDLDHRDFGPRAWELEDQLTEQHPTYTVRTGDGWHLYYDASNLPEGIRVPGKLCDGIDVKWNGYVVAAPSTHPSGISYHVTSDVTPALFPLELLGARR